MKKCNVKNNDKLYIIVRRDITPGYKLAQACHGIRQFSEEHGEIDKKWFKNSNYICVLETLNEQSLEQLVEHAKIKGVAHSLFREPDLNNEITVLVLEPSWYSRKICKKLKLALGG